MFKICKQTHVENIYVYRIQNRLCELTWETFINVGCWVKSF